MDSNNPLRRPLCRPSPSVWIPFRRRMRPKNPNTLLLSFRRTPSLVRRLVCLGSELRSLRLCRLCCRRPMLVSLRRLLTYLCPLGLQFRDLYLLEHPRASCATLRSLQMGIPCPPRVWHRHRGQRPRPSQIEKLPPQRWLVQGRPLLFSPNPNVSEARNLMGLHLRTQLPSPRDQLHSLHVTCNPVPTPRWA